MNRETEEQFREFVAVSYQRLLRAAYLMTGNVADAEDLVQTALARTALAWKRLRESEHLDRYVHKIVVNEFISSRRRLWRKRESAVGQVPDRVGPDSFAPVDERERLRVALAGLPPPQRAAVVMRHYADLSEAQAAELLGCSVGTIKSLTSRGLAGLRKTLAESALERGRTR